MTIKKKQTSASKRDRDDRRTHLSPAPSDVAPAPRGHGASLPGSPWRRGTGVPDGPPKLEPDFPAASRAQRHHDESAVQRSSQRQWDQFWTGLHDAPRLVQGGHHRGIRAPGATRGAPSLQRLTATLCWRSGVHNNGNNSTVMLMLFLFFLRSKTTTRRPLNVWSPSPQVSGQLLFLCAPCFGDSSTSVNLNTGNFRHLMCAATSRRNCIRIKFWSNQEERRYRLTLINQTAVFTQRFYFFF